MKNIRKYIDKVKWENKAKKETIIILYFLNELELFENNNDIHIIKKLMEIDCLKLWKDK